MRKVLLVDDAAFMRMRCAKLLTAEGFQVAEAANGREAVEQYEAVRPDLVLMDITMPEMDGITATREITQRDRAANVIMVSALGQQSMVMEAIRAGARDFVVKPYEPDRVLGAIRRIFPQ
ncbi:MAG: cheY [Symbiobacteriaceae bacterium]|jgi:two-component system chemotaxis response regulator CheY|nr:cheY [Symbiobacteriaceae bacterium]